jgi:hypothetical protein
MNALGSGIHKHYPRLSAASNIPQRKAASGMQAIFSGVQTRDKDNMN